MLMQCFFLLATDDSSGTSTIRWVTEASLISKTKRVFADHVRTCLRYREITSSRTYLYDGIIIDQDILIGLCPRKEVRILTDLPVFEMLFMYFTFSRGKLYKE